MSGGAHVRPAENVRDAFSFEQLQGGAGLEALLEHEGRAGVHGADQRVAEAADPEQRHGRVDAVAGAQDTELAQPHAMADGCTVCVDGSLGVGGAAGGVDEHHRVRRRHLRLDGLEQLVLDLVTTGQQLGDRPRVGPLAVTEHPHRAQVRMRQDPDLLSALAGQTLDRRCQSLEVVMTEVAGGDDERGDVGVAQGPSELASGRVGAERHEEGADAAGGQPAHDPVRPVRREQPDRACPCPPRWPATLWPTQQSVVPLRGR